MPTSPRPTLHRFALATLVAAAAIRCTHTLDDQRPEQLAHHGQALMNGSAPSSPPIGSLLQYFGGAVIPNVHVVPVFWNAAVHTNLMTVPNNIDAYFNTVLNSAYLDFLGQYDTVGEVSVFDGAAGTNQKIGRGTETPGITLPSLFHAASSITVADLQSELQQQIGAGVLPVPDSNTEYFVFMPSTVTVTDTDGTQSCVYWCGEHSTMEFNSMEVPYAIIGDMTKGGCKNGCGAAGDSAFQHATSVTSHELAESITDVNVGVSSNSWDTLAWYDPAGGEIGDLCNGKKATVGTYRVQQLFSNQTRACVSAFAAQSNTFGLAITPVYASIGRSSAQVFNITTTVTTGTAQSIALTTSALPTGLSAKFGATTITAGGSTTLTLSTNATIAWQAQGPGVLVLATAPSDTQSQVLSVDVCPTTSTTVPINGDVEASYCDWSVNYASILGSAANHYMDLVANNGATTPVPQATAQISFTVPTGPNVLSFSWQSACTGTIAQNSFDVTLSDNATGEVLTLMPATCTNQATFATRATDISAFAGRAVTLTAEADSNVVASQAVTFDIDNVVVASGTETLTNGNFEASPIPTAGWTLSGGGAPPVASTDEARSPTHSLFLGSIESPIAAGTSIASQTVTITPTATSATLSFYYLATSLDTAGHDQWLVTATNLTTHVTTTLLSTTAITSSRAWTNASFDLSALIGKPVQLTFQVTNDGTAGTATGIWIDDVSLVTK
ncbi:MAG: hypothetical protein ACHREM_17815 [Polyangiales bacterium]